MNQKTYRLLVWDNYPMHVCSEHLDRAIQENGEPDGNLDPEVECCAICEEEKE